MRHLVISTLRRRRSRESEQDRGFALLTSIFLTTAVGGLAVILTGALLSQSNTMLLLTRNVATVHAVNASAVDVFLRPCSATERLRQTFSIGDSSTFQESNAAGSLNGWCLMPNNAPPSSRRPSSRGRAATTPRRGGCWTPRWVPERPEVVTVSPRRTDNW